MPIPAVYHRLACGMELIVGLDDTPHRWTFGEWAVFLRMFRASEARVIVLKVIYEMSLSEIGERMELSRCRVDEIWKRALRRANKTADITRYITQHMEESNALPDSKSGNEDSDWR